VGRVGQAKCNSEVNVTPPGNSREEYFLFFQSLSLRYYTKLKVLFFKLILTMLKLSTVFSGL